ncbi:hypothetical protein NKR23_g712 [Pleurostoma richardsiae]|uniref:Uncharacterized protein n=1 Tax=Pleurostoma richardsiae TaxID=41990 RepID=A0AA38S6Z5_9PEZI|nr:hypothetical protein NKR23_g712 [Pleurostoma richardsiae]
MPISALPEATVRLLGSPLVITTPVSVVKELVENAIDARATSIEVLVSRNTVDKIQVRDNGDGIASCDYDCLGRRGRTSKLRSFEEIRLVGGTSFGFRGEALASANALGMITITTRTSTDPVATKLHLAPGVGGVTNQERTSAPVGTTVSVKDIFASLPVRKKIATKEAPKTISRSVMELLSPA